MPVSLFSLNFSQYLNLMRDVGLISALFLSPLCVFEGSTLSIFCHFAQMKWIRRRSRDHSLALLMSRWFVTFLLFSFSLSLWCSHLSLSSWQDGSITTYEFSLVRWNHIESTKAHASINVTNTLFQTRESIISKIANFITLNNNVNVDRRKRKDEVKYRPQWNGRRAEYMINLFAIELITAFGVTVQKKWCTFSSIILSIRNHHLHHFHEKKSKTKSMIEV